MIYLKEISLYLILILFCSLNRLVKRKFFINVFVFIVYWMFSVMNFIVVDLNNFGRIFLVYWDFIELFIDWDGKFDDIIVLDLSYNNLMYFL